MELNELTTTSLIGEIAASHPIATRVFARHGIDFCCGGGAPLNQACSSRGLDPVALLDEIRTELEGAGRSATNWSQEPLSDLIDHILSAYHQPLREELPRLETMARKVVRVHGDKDPERLPALLDVVVELKRELEDHMMKEERILFPMIVAGQGSGAGGPVSVMEHEHAQAARALAELRRLTDDFSVPAAACNTWRALWTGLESLETDLKHHIHLENNILFPRALAS